MICYILSYTAAAEDANGVLPTLVGKPVAV